MKTINIQLFNAEAVESETTNSPHLDLSHCFSYAIDMSYSGSTLNASAKLQAGWKDDNGSITWRDLPDSGATAEHTLSASGGNHQWYVTDVTYQFVRVAVTADSNIATVTARASAKGV